jgi:hypothetical protein
MMRTALLLALALVVGVALANAAPIRAAAADEAPAYTVFHSPPAQLDALLWAIVDCYPYRDLEEAKRDFLQWAEGKDNADVWQMDIWPDEQKLVALESKFGDMPEYWQARYFFEYTQTKGKDTGLLEKAHELAPNDPATMYFLADARLKFAEYGLEETDDAFADQLAKREYKREAIELMLRAAECEPQNAVYFYDAAQAVREFGDFDEVTELLERGNAAPVNEAVQLFPLSYMLRNFRGIRDGDDGTERFRLLAYALISNPLPNYIERREMMKEYQVIFSMNADMELLNTLHVYACRYGQETYAPLIQQLVAMVLVSYVNTMAVENGALTYDEVTVKSLAAMNNARGTVRGLARSTSIWSQFMYDEGYYPGGSTLFGRAHTTAADAWSYYTVAWEDQIAEFLYIGPAIAEQLWRLEMYRYGPDGTISRVSPTSPAPPPPPSVLENVVQ